MYTFGYFNGRDGREQTFDTLDAASEAAWIKWQHLTPKEKKQYTNAEDGAYFAVFEGGNDLDDCSVVLDWQEVIERERRGEE